MLYNKLANYYDVYVLHSGKRIIVEDTRFNQIISKQLNLGPFKFQPILISELKKKYDVIISMFDIRWPLNYLLFYFVKKDVKVIYWGGWLTQNKLANFLRVFFMKKNVKSILYSESHKNEFIKKGVKKNNLIVANNSLHIEHRLKSYTYKKKYIVFSGSFNKRKQIPKILNLFEDIFPKIDEKINLILIGDGEEFEIVRKLSCNSIFSKRIILLGRVINQKKLANIYKESICAISYGQAGLSILQSLAYGVPFICPIKAISGGEIDNVKHNYNGYLTSNDSEFKNKIIELSNNKDLAIELGKNSFNYFNESCTIENMVRSFQLAIS